MRIAILAQQSIFRKRNFADTQSGRDIDLLIRRGDFEIQKAFFVRGLVPLGRFSFSAARQGWWLFANGTPSLRMSVLRSKRVRLSCDARWIVRRIVCSCGAIRAEKVKGRKERVRIIRWIAMQNLGLR